MGQDADSSGGRRTSYQGEIRADSGMNRSRPVRSERDGGRRCRKRFRGSVQRLSRARETRQTSVRSQMAADIVKVDLVGRRARRRAGQRFLRHKRIRVVVGQCLQNTYPRQQCHQEKDCGITNATAHHSILRTLEPDVNHTDIR